ncbi:MAG: Fur family transcriptional regulator [Chloroflexota bacterium]
MLISPMTQNQNQVQQIVNELRQRGERVTIQRRMVIEALCTTKGHQTVNDVRDTLKVHGEAMTESTVYRILRWLNEHGFASQTDLGAQGVVYELLYATPHHHLVCLACGSITALDDGGIETLRKHVQDEYSFEPRVEHMAIFGWCKECQRKNLVGTFAHPQSE